MPVAAPAQAASNDEAVVILHGLARGSHTMGRLQNTLEEAGYRVTNLDYPSTRAEPAELIDMLGRSVRQCCADAARVHFVTASIGSIITRGYLAEEHPDNLGRVVMIAPPNRGSEIIDLIGGLFLVRRLLGPTAVALRTDEGGLTQSLPPIDYDVGIIVGTRSSNPISALVIPGPDDGGVSVEGAKLEGMKDFVTVARTHSSITSAPEVSRHALYFLRTGRFDPALREEKNSP